MDATAVLRGGEPTSTVHPLSRAENLARKKKEKQMKLEEWKPVPELPGYEASSMGGVRRRDPSGKWRRLIPCCNGRGYMRLNINKKTFYVHRLVASAFFGRRPELQVNHKDGNKANNKVDNLEYVTAQQNAEHAAITGLVRTTISEVVVDMIRVLYREGFTSTEISQLVGIRAGTVANIAAGRQRKYLSGGAKCSLNSTKAVASQGTFN